MHDAQKNALDKSSSQFKNDAKKLTETEENNGRELKGAANRAFLQTGSAPREGKSADGGGSGSSGASSAAMGIDSRGPAGSALDSPADAASFGSKFLAGSAQADVAGAGGAPGAGAGGGGAQGTLQNQLVNLESLRDSEKALKNRSVSVPAGEGSGGSSGGSQSGGSGGGPGGGAIGTDGSRVGLIASAGLLPDSGAPASDAGKGGDLSTGERRPAMTAEGYPDPRAANVRARAGKNPRKGDADSERAFEGWLSLAGFSMPQSAGALGFFLFLLLAFARRDRRKRKSTLRRSRPA